MTTTVPDPRTAAALAARHRSTDAALGRVRDAVTRLRREKTRSASPRSPAARMSPAPSSMTTPTPEPRSPPRLPKPANAGLRWSPTRTRHARRPGASEP